MKSGAAYAMVFVTAPDITTARKLAALALQARLVACANLIPKIESHYWWQGKLERSAEVLVLFKTTRRNLKRLETLVLSEHPYDTPEFVVLQITAGSKAYLDWITAEAGQKVC
jgi:periplasmic divalent cation tolerance protein